MKLFFAKVRETAIAPTRKYPDDAGLDLYACLDEPLWLEPRSRAKIPTGISIQMPAGYDGFLWPKGRQNTLVGGGVIDEGYQGEIIVKLFNPTDELVIIKHGDPIAQLILQQVIKPIPEELPVEELFATKTERGNSGGIHRG